jgi:hypothetical protein
MSNDQMITVTGKIEKRGFGSGTWALVSEEGMVYELHKLPEKLKQNRDRVTLTGQLKPDVMTLAMIGPVLEVQSYQLD